MRVSIADAIDILKKGELVSLPTETVYGLAANATSDDAVEKIYKLKQRPSNNPLIIHFRDINQVENYAYISNNAKKLASNFWPGPLTLVLKSKGIISQKASAGLDTIAVRCPYSPQFLEVLDNIDFPLAAPSANISNMISPTHFSDVESYFPNLPIVDGGSCLVGIESTILDITNSPRILRHGSITKEKLEEVLGIIIEDFKTNNILAPGMMKRHYAPKCEIYINQTQSSDEYYSINFANSKLHSKYSQNLSIDGYLEVAAKTLFKTLKQAENTVIEKKLKGIKVAIIPNEGVGTAINDKLNRASTK